MEKLVQPVLEWAFAGRARGDEADSGDQHVVQAFSGGVMMAVIDGLGHGPEAAEAASVAVRTLQENADEHVVALIQRCHEKLLYGRGAVMSVASFDYSSLTMTWIGVGNVNGLFLHARGDGLERETLLLRGGVVGGSLPSLQAKSIPFCAGDSLVFATDGVNDFYDDLNRNEPSKKTADRLLAKYLKGDDDAMVLVARFLENAT